MVFRTESLGVNASVAQVLMLLEYNEYNIWHKKIGINDWLVYRPKVPAHIPEKQRGVYVYSLIKKHRKEKRKERRNKLWRHLKLMILAILPKRP